jgi:hypothetical protein
VYAAVCSDSDQDNGMCQVIDEADAEKRHLERLLDDVCARTACAHLHLLQRTCEIASLLTQLRDFVDDDGFGELTGVFFTNYFTSSTNISDIKEQICS